MVYHVLNRGNAKRTIFEKDGDYAAFERILGEVQKRLPMRILAWCLMPNHWHLVLWPHGDGDLSAFLRLVSLLHTHRWHAHRASVGTGHLYQGRFKAFAVQQDRHFLNVCRYVERNALTAGLVGRAEHWRWCSLRQSASPPDPAHPELAEWPVPRPSNWIEEVNQALTPKELETLRTCARRGRPYGAPDWTHTIAQRLGVLCAVRERGRPKKGPDPFFSRT